MAEKGIYTYDYPRPTVGADALVLSVIRGKLSALLIRRGQEPFAGYWAIPGGFMEMDEPLAQTALRELEEETGVTGVDLHFFGIFDRPGRDPRARSIIAAYVGVADAAALRVNPGDDAAEAAWVWLDEATGLAFDHNEILDAGVTHALADPRLRAALDNLGFGKGWQRD
jgi:8-oxo-dGTP diphosphatase